MNYEQQKLILRDLASKVAEISELPIQKETKKAWKGLNSLKPVRPMFMIDQLPWGQLNYNDELTLLCEDPLLRHFEWQLRETLYRWNHLPDDRVVSKDFRVHKAVSHSGYGVSIEEELIQGEAGTAANSHKYKSVIQNEEDIQKIKFPVISESKKDSEAIVNTAKDLFDGILNIRQSGMDNYGHVWDFISIIHGVEESIIDIMDRPEFVHKLVSHCFGAYHHAMDQYEKLGLIDVGCPLIHCTGAFSNELPGYNDESEEELEKCRYTAKSAWTYGAAQLFSMVSPAIHEEFEIEYQKKWYARFGLGYYGCCEPLDLKINVIKKIPNVRKISMSPWVDMERGAEAMDGKFVFSRKPNPAFLANDIAWDTTLLRKDLEDACRIAAKYKNPCELILKDVSTIDNKPQRLWEWAKIAADVVGRR